MSGKGRGLRLATVIHITLVVIAHATVASAGALAPAQVVDAFNEAIDRGDRMAATAHLTKDVMIFEMGFANRSRSDYESFHLGVDIEFASTTTRRLLSRRQGSEGELHWVLSLYADEGTHEGKPVKQSTVETVLLRRVAGHWRIAHLHWSVADRLESQRQAP